MSTLPIEQRVENMKQIIKGMDFRQLKNNNCIYQWHDGTLFEINNHDFIKEVMRFLDRDLNLNSFDIRIQPRIRGITAERYYYSRGFDFYIYPYNIAISLLNLESDVTDEHKMKKYNDLIRDKWRGYKLPDEIMPKDLIIFTMGYGLTNESIALKNEYEELITAKLIAYSDGYFNTARLPSKLLESDMVALRDIIESKRQVQSDIINPFVNSIVPDRFWYKDYNVVENSVRKVRYAYEPHDESPVKLRNLDIYQRLSKPEVYNIPIEIDPDVKVSNPEKMVLDYMINVAGVEPSDIIFPGPGMYEPYYPYYDDYGDEEELVPTFYIKCCRAAVFIKNFGPDVEDRNLDENYRVQAYCSENYYAICIDEDRLLKDPDAVLHKVFDKIMAKYPTYLNIYKTTGLSYMYKEHDPADLI